VKNRNNEDGVMKICVIAVAMLATLGWARADEAFPVSDSATGRFYACNGEDFCQDVEQEFASVEGCQVGMMPFMAKWIGDHEGFRLKTGRYECRPKAQVRV
jgi:hypothetical protein